MAALIVHLMRAASIADQDAMVRTINRISAMALARHAVSEGANLKSALGKLCDDLSVRPDACAISIRCDVPNGIPIADPVQISTIKLIVNELAVNAIEHGHAEGIDGVVTISAYHDCAVTVVTVDDDGLPFPELDQIRETGIGLELVKALTAAINGEVAFPTGDSKKFEIIIPARM